MEHQLLDNGSSMDVTASVTPSLLHLRRSILALCMVVVLALACSSCKDAYSQYKEEWKTFERGYSSEDIRTAEQSLHHYRKRMLYWRDTGKVDVDFDHVLAIANARLSYLYYVQGASNEANKYFTLATNHLNMPAKRGKGEYFPFTPTDLYKVVAHGDTGLDVRWTNGKSR